MWGQNEIPPIEKESTCEKFENSQWVKKHDQRIRQIISIQTPHANSDIGSVFNNPQFKVLWEKHLKYHLDDARLTLGSKINVAYIENINSKMSDAKSARILLAKIYSKHLLDMRKCATSSNSFVFSTDLYKAIRYRKSSSFDPDNFSIMADALFNQAQFIIKYNPKIPVQIAGNISFDETLSSFLRDVIRDTQLTSFIAATSKNSDYFIALVQADTDKKFTEFFPALEIWINQENYQAQIAKQEETSRKEKAQKESDEKARYAASPDGQLDTAFNQFMTIEQCYKVREGFAVGYVSLGEYQESRVQVKEIQNLLKPKLKESIDEKWKRIAASFNFTAKPNLFLNEQAIQLACQGAVSSLNSVYNRISPIKGPSKSF